jgi:hypothetical protein
VLLGGYAGNTTMGPDGGVFIFNISGGIFGGWGGFGWLPYAYLKHGYADEALSFRTLVHR